MLVLALVFVCVLELEFVCVLVCVFVLEFVLVFMFVLVLVFVFGDGDGDDDDDGALCSNKQSHKAARVSSGRPRAARPPPSEARPQQLLRCPLAEPGGCGPLGKTRATVGRGGALRAPGLGVAGPGDIRPDCTRRTLLTDCGLRYSRPPALRHA